MCADQRVEMHDFQQKKYKPLDRDAVIRMAAAGMSQGRIATALGVAQSSVQRVLQAARRGTP
jgi:DNA-binding transcriptional regulator LsrR (DeoR family)